jgi:hypothetical protein
VIAAIEISGGRVEESGGRRVKCVSMKDKEHDQGLYWESACLC